MIKPYYTRLQFQQSPEYSCVWTLGLTSLRIQDYDLDRVQVFLCLWTLGLSALYIQDSDHNRVWVFLCLWTLGSSSLCIQDSDHNRVWVFLCLWTLGLSSLCIQDSDHNRVQVFLCLWTHGLSSLLYTRLWSQRSPSIPVSMDAWFEFSIIYKTLITTEFKCSCISGRLVWLLYYLLYYPRDASISRFTRSLATTTWLTCSPPIPPTKGPWTGFATSWYCISDLTLLL